MDAQNTLQFRTIAFYANLHNIKLIVKSLLMSISAPSIAFVLHSKY